MDPAAEALVTVLKDILRRHPIPSAAAPAPPSPGRTGTEPLF